MFPHEKIQYDKALNIHKYLKIIKINVRFLLNIYLFNIFLLIFYLFNLYAKNHLIFVQRPCSDFMCLYMENNTILHPNMKNSIG